MHAVCAERTDRTVIRPVRGETDGEEMSRCAWLSASDAHLNVRKSNDAQLLQLQQRLNLRLIVFEHSSVASRSMTDGAVDSHCLKD